MNQTKSYGNFVKMGILFLMMLAVFFDFRLIFTFYFTQLELFSIPFLDFINLLTAALRFDVVVALYALLPLLLLAIFVSFVRKEKLEKWSKIFQSFFLWYGTFAVVVFSVITTFDFFFFKTYKKHFSTLIYGLKDDATFAVLVSIWADFPVIKILMFFVIVIWITYFFVAKIAETNPIFEIKTSFNKILFFIALIGFYFVGMRGSLDMFPINLTHATVTENHRLNQMTINSVFALKEALSAGNEIHLIHTDTEKSLLENGFNNIDEALKIYLESDYRKDKSIEQLYDFQTNHNEFLEKNPPNVVFVLMESFSRHMMDLHSGKVNTLGSLASEMKDCIVFKNTLAADNLTVYTLENLLIASPFRSISQSKYQDVALKTSILNPFKEGNYRSTFLYGGEYDWRNVGNFMKTQGFDEIISKGNLEKMYDKPDKFIWGMHDEYLYDAIFKKLDTSTKPQFIFALTISNHTPNDIPPSYKSIPILLSDSDYKSMGFKNETLKRNFLSYQYAADQMGKFIHRIKNSRLAENTIIIFTGDHNLHIGFKYNKTQKFLERNVPIVFYIPPAYLPKESFDIHKFASHKDIFPTVFQLALSKKKYYKTGNNLFDKKPSFSINAHNFIADKIGAVRTENGIDYYLWRDETFTHLEKVKKNEHLDSLLQKLKAYKAVKTYTIQKELARKK